MREMLIELGRGLGYIGVGIVIYVLGRVRKMRAKARVIPSTYRSDLAIQDALSAARIQLQADRVFLSRFHNGDYFVDGSEIMRNTRTNESVKPGVSYTVRQFDGVLNSSVPEEVKLVVDEGPSFTLCDALKDGHFRRMLQAQGTTAIARCAVRRGGRIIGFVGAEWTHRTEKPANIDLLVTLAGRVEQMIGLKLAA